MTTAERDPRHLPKRLFGCLGIGGLGALGVFGVLAFLAAGLSNTLSGCDTDLGSPGEGTDSLHLPVTVTPRTGVRPDQVVRIRSTAFDADSIVSVAVCLRKADTQRKGVDACDTDLGTRFATNGGGRLDATFRVPRVITVGDRAYDCAGRAGRCLVVAADAGDFDRSGGQPITFARGLPSVPVKVHGARPGTDLLPAGGSPNGPVRAGTKVTLLASGFQPHEPLLVAWCTDDLAALGPIEACEPLDVRDAVGAIMLRDLPADGLRADAAGGVGTTVEARGWIQPFGDDLSKALENLGTSSTTIVSGATTTVPPGAVDCADRPGRCSIVIASAADTQRSAVLPYTLVSG